MAEGRKPKPPTLTDVAKLAGVSIPTASRALNGGVRGSNSGSEELRERVRDAARQLGYSVSPAAQAVKGGRARTLALVVSDIDDFGSATMIAGVMHAAESRGISVAVRATGDDAEREQGLLRALRGERHRGVIFATSRTTDAARERAMDESLRDLHDQGARVVVIGDSDLPYPRVVVDNEDAAFALARGLVAAGHRSFSVVAGPDDQITSRDRVAGFLRGLAADGIAADSVRVVHADFSRDGGYESVARLGETPEAVDVIAAMSDAMAVGVIAGLRDRGVAADAMPEVSGFDHVPMLGDVLPFFSTVEVPLEKFGEAALSLIFDAAAPAATDDPPAVRLRARPIVRGVALDLD